jgi:hypothetical protein
MNLSVIIIASMPTKGMKSIGNVGLLPITKKQLILEKHIENIYATYPTAEIVIVGGFESKRMQKALKKHKNIKYVHHDIKNYSNETQSFYEGLVKCKNTKCIIFNANCVANKVFWSKIKYRTKTSIAIINNNKKFNSNIGATLTGEKINYIFYGLPNKITNIYLLQQKHIEYFLKNYSEFWMSKYLFETMNILSKYEPLFYQEINNNVFTINSMKDYNKITKKEAHV